MEDDIIVKREVWLEQFGVAGKYVKRDEEGEYINVPDEASEHGEQTVKVYLPLNLQLETVLEDSSDTEQKGDCECGACYKHF